MIKGLVSSLIITAVLTVASVAFAGSVMEKDIIRVGTEATYPPFEFRNENNEITGFDIDLVKLIGEKMDKEIEIVDMAFDWLIPSLMTGKIDMVAAGITNTEKRKEKVSFSNVYYHIENAFVTKIDNEDINSLDDIAGKIATVQIGTAQDTFITELGTAAEIKRFQKNDDALREVMLGRGDFCVINLTVANSYLRNNETFKGKLKIAVRNFINEPDEGIALAVPKGDAKFLEAVNAALAEIEESGELQNLKEKYQID